MLEQVMGFLGEILEDPDAPGERVEPDTSYVLDSLAVIEVVTFLEERFGLSLERSDLDRIETPLGIVDLVLAKQAADS